MLLKILKFLASLKLALVLLAVLIVATIVGTVLESRINADVARAMIYGHWWFDLWLTLLSVNLLAATIERWPWKGYQIGFVITHFGIIVMLIGGLIDRAYGIEGFMRLRRGAPATNILEFRDQDLIVTVGNQRTRTTVNPKTLLSGKDFDIPVASPDPAVKVELLDKHPPLIELSLASRAMGQQSLWLFCGDSTEAGPLTVRFVNGMPPQPKSAQPDAKGKMVPRRERIFVFAKHDSPIVKTIAGEATRATAQLSVNPPAVEPILNLTLLDKNIVLPVKKENVDKPQPLADAPDWKFTLLGYFPNFRMDGGQPATLDDKPENPAVFFELTGPLVPESENAAGEGQRGAAQALTVYLGHDQKLRYFFRSPGAPERSGELLAQKPVEAWSKDSEFAINRFIPSGLTEMLNEHPEMLVGFPIKQIEQHNPGLLCRVTSGGESRVVFVEETVAKQEHPEVVLLGGRQIELMLPHRYKVLDFKVGLEKFYAPHQEGRENTMEFMSFESTLSFQEGNDSSKWLDTLAIRADSSFIAQAGLTATPGQPLWLTGAITAWDEQSVTLELQDRTSLVIPRSELYALQKNTRKISMNRPTTYPNTWYGPMLGTSYKFSQSGHDPNDPDYSGVQVLCDPGWMPKWVGSLMICFGIFAMYYLKPYLKGREREKMRQKIDSGALNERAPQTASK